MRKKSHILLAGFFADECPAQDLMRYRKAFCIGSILPDLSPKMITEPHEFATSFEDIKDLVGKLTSEWERLEYRERYFWRGLGVVMHYLADYFTFPHNDTFPGTLKDHCLYERDLKYALRNYTQTEKARSEFRSQMLEGRNCRDEQEIFSFLEEEHSRYLQEAHSPEEDCRWIVQICSRVFASVICLMESRTYQTAPAWLAKSA